MNELNAQLAIHTTAQCTCVYQTKFARQLGFRKCAENLAQAYTYTGSEGEFHIL